MKSTPVNYNKFKALVLFLFALVLFSFTGCFSHRNLSDLSEDYMMQSGMLRGYLTFRELPNSLALLPPPPEEGSAALELDQETSKHILKTTDSLRWQQAIKDANLIFPEALLSFEEIIGMQITADTTPYLYLMLQRVLTDAALSTYTAKTHYKRQRPYRVNGEDTCTPQLEEGMNDGSYPSGHAAIGWSWALILTEIFPEHTNKLLHRGREFGQSRMVCNVHWASDVAEGRYMGSATVARLHGNANFMADLSRAKKEIR